MALSTSQLTTLKADIAANTATVTWQGSPIAINTLAATTNPGDSDANDAIANWYNVQASPDFIVWRDIRMEIVLDTIRSKDMTPADPVPTTTQLDVMIWLARSMACQGKQFNLQILTQGRAIAPMKRSSYRNAMSDCLTDLPAGTGGALLEANWNAVRNAAKFPSNRIEKLLATGTGTTGSPADMGYEGTIAYPDVEAARKS